MAKKATSRTAKPAINDRVARTTAKAGVKSARTTAKAGAGNAKAAAKAARTTAKAKTTSRSARPTTAAKRPRSTAGISEAFLDSLSGPARRALEHAGLTTARKLAAKREADVLGLHGVGPASLPALRRSLATAGLRFRA